MASILVYIDRDEDRPADGALRVLGEARRLASEAGATLYAAALLPSRDSTAAWIETLGRAGADRVVLVDVPAVDGPPIWSSHGRALGAVTRQLRPLLAVFADGPTARELAPRLAAHVGAAFVPDATFERSGKGEVVVARRILAINSRRKVVTDDLGQTVIATLAPWPYAVATGDDDADVIFVDRPPDADDGVEYRGSRDDPGAALAAARVIVTAGAGVGTAANLELCKQLADALGGELGSTRPACRRGLGAADRVVGVDAHRVAPQLYIACGASGSAAHLGGVSTDATIVAVNRDPEAPIFKVATYGIVGDISDVVPGLIAEAHKLAPRRATP